MTYTTKKSRDFQRYVSQAEAARIIGTTKQTVANLISRGVFTITGIAGRVLVLRSEAENYLKKPKGRPQKKQAIEADTRARSSKPIASASDKTDKYISQAEVARLRGVSDQAVANLIRRGRLKTKIVAGRTVLVRSEVEAFVAMPKTGRPPKKKTAQKKTASKRSS